MGDSLPPMQHHSLAERNPSSFGEAGLGSDPSWQAWKQWSLLSFVFPTALPPSLETPRF